MKRSEEPGMIRGSNVRTKEGHFAAPWNQEKEYLGSKIAQERFATKGVRYRLRGGVSDEDTNEKETRRNQDKG